MPEPNSWKLETWSKGFYGVYSINDDQRTYSDLWLHATSHASAVAEDIRLNLFDAVIHDLGNVFAWLFSFAERLALDLYENTTGRGVTAKHGKNWTEWILHKYPQVCNTCGLCPCTCAIRRDVMEMRSGDKKREYEKLMVTREPQIKRAYNLVIRRRRLDRVMTMPRLFDMFHSIYGGTLWGSSIFDTCFHFLEEIGEVSKEITYLEGIGVKYTRPIWLQEAKRKHSKDWNDKYSVGCVGLTREMADVFSWGSALCFKVAQLSKQQWEPREALVEFYEGKLGTDPSVGLSVDRYRFVCRYCGEKVCSKVCVDTQIKKRLRKGQRETQKRFAYEL